MIKHAEHPSALPSDKIIKLFCNLSTVERFRCFQVSVCVDTPWTWHAATLTVSDVFQQMSMTAVYKKQPHRRSINLLSPDPVSYQTLVLYMTLKANGLRG